MFFLMYNIQMSIDKESRMPTEDTGLLHRFGFRRNIRITNSCDRKAYVIVAPTPIRTVSTIGVEKLGNIEYEQHGEYKSEEMLILPGHTKYFELETAKIYVSVLIEVTDCNWKQWRKNRLINSSTEDYNITKYAINECFEESFLDYSRK
jgi:hypothetical protein